MKGMFLGLKVNKWGCEAERGVNSLATQVGTQGLPSSYTKNRSGLYNSLLLMRASSSPVQCFFLALFANI